MYGVTVCDVTDVMSSIETNTKFTFAWQDRRTKPNGTNVWPTRVILSALLEFLYEWMPLHLIHYIAALVCEETQVGSTKRVIAFEFAMRK